MTFSEWKMLNINMFALKINHIQFIFFKPAYFFSTVCPSTPLPKRSEQDCQIAVSSEDRINNQDSDPRNKPDKYTWDEASWTLKCTVHQHTFWKLPDDDISHREESEKKPCSCPFRRKGQDLLCFWYLVEPNHTFPNSMPYLYYANVFTKMSLAVFSNLKILMTKLSISLNTLIISWRDIQER